MRANVIRVGNSQGLRIPKVLLDQCGIHDVVEVTVVDGRLTIAPVDSPRAGWAEAARKMAARAEDDVLEEPTPTTFDESEWQWTD